MEKSVSDKKIKQNGYSNKTRLAKLNKRREEAESRNAAWQKLSNKQKIEACLRRRGECKKQLAKLRKQKPLKTAEEAAKDIIKHYGKSLDVLVY